MDNKTEYYEDLKTIKRVMEESSRFISLSGLSGVFAGLVALVGAAIAVFFFLDGRILLRGGAIVSGIAMEIDNLKIKLFTEAAIILILAIAVAFYFSYRKSVKKGLRMWTPVSKRLLINLFIPLLTGGLLILIFYSQHQWQLVIPAMLIFYGLGLVNAGKFTYSEVFYLGLAEIITGLSAALFPVYGIIFWSFGFGLLHITYGLAMYRKYER